MSTPTRVRVYLACSLDGFLAGPGDDLGWLDEPDGGADGVDAGEDDRRGPDTGALGFEDFLADVGALLMGRRTYEVVAGFEAPWPYGARPVLVATHRPLEPVVPQVRAVAGDIGALLAEARRVAAGGDVYLDGGALIRQAVDAGAVDEYVLTLAPVILGAGVPLFAGVAQRRRLALVAHHRYGRDMVQLLLRPLAVSPHTVPRTP
jgi:dihydrofolate reductase